MRIGIVAPPWFELPPRGYGGIESMCYWLAEGLVARGHDVTLIGAGPRHTSARFVSTVDEPPTARVGEAYPEVIHLAEAARALESADVEVVHDHTLAGVLLAFGRDAPTVVTAHGPVNADAAAYYRRLDGCISLVGISDVQRRSGPGLPWVGTVYNGIPTDEYTFREGKEDFVLFLGRMSAEKGAPIAIDAARAAGVPIVLAAKCNEPPEQAYFEAFVRPKLGPGVEWFGEADTDAKKDLLARARCLVFPIQWEEPFGIVMVEAMASGTPVVALKGGSVPEVVVDGVTGIICDTPEELPAAIARVEGMSPAACRAQAARFDIARMAEGYEAVYSEALRARASHDDGRHAAGRSLGSVPTPLPYVCEQCSRGFPSITALRVHAIVDEHRVARPGERRRNESTSAARTRA
jgi:glycosyltransferase involved in cell wall biosynthesis